MCCRAGLAFAWLFGIGASIFLAACKQGEGERCEINPDCNSGLVCEMQAGTQSGGRCRQGVTATVRQDAAATGDAARDGAVDASGDLATDGSADGALPEAGSESAADGDGLGAADGVAARDSTRPDL